MTIPIYRAKKIDSDESIEGYYSDNLFLCMGDIQGHYISYKKINVVGKEITLQESIDPTTLAIHFPHMLDSQGNKIFASLSEDGKGGDCTFMENGYNETFCLDRLNACVVLKSRNYECRCFKNGSRNETTFNTYKIIGIQE